MLGLSGLYWYLLGVIIEVLGKMLGLKAVRAFLSDDGVSRLTSHASSSGFSLGLDVVASSGLFSSSFFDISVLVLFSFVFFFNLNEIFRIFFMKIK